MAYLVDRSCCYSCPQKKLQTKNMKQLASFLFIILKSVDLHEEAGKENEQTLANLSPAEETTSKDEDEIFAGAEIKKHSTQD